METLTVVKEIAVILLLSSAFGLCVIVAVGLVKLFPHLRRATENWANTTESTAQIAGDFAVVSRDVAADLRQTTASTAKIIGDFAAISDDVAGDVRKTTASTAEGAEYFAQTGRNAMESSAYLRTAMQLLELLGPAGKAVNFANMGIGRVSGMVSNILRRIRT